MESSVTRRTFVQAMGVGTAAGLAPLATRAEDAPPKSIKIIAVACSPRVGKTTAQALTYGLEAAKAVDPERIETELIDLADMEIPGYMAAGLPLRPGHRDDFPQVAEKLIDRRVAGIIIGSPVYYRNVTALCKAFIDRCRDLRVEFALSDKVGGAVAVGGGRNGGQELTLQAIHSAMLCHEMIVVGDGRPTAHAGGAVWNAGGKDDISGDEIGLATVRNLGRRVAEVALKRAPAE